MNLFEEKFNYSDYINLFNLIEDSIIIFNYDCEIMFINQVGTLHTGLSQNELYGRKMTEIFPPEIANKQIEIVKKVIDEGVVLRAGIEPTKPGGTEKWFETNIYPLVQSDGTKCAVVIAKDVSNLFVTDFLSENFFRQAEIFVKKISDLLFFKDSKGNYLLANDAFCTFFGKNTNEIIGHTDFDFMPKEAAEQCLKSDEEVIKSKETKISEEVIHFQDGDNVYFEVIKSPIFDRDNKFIGIIGIGRDVSEKKKTLEEINNQKIMLNEILENVQEGIGILDENENIIYCNPSYGLLFESEIENLIGRNIQEFISEDSSGKFKDAVKKRKSGIKEKYEINIKTNKGNRKTVSVNVTPKYDSTGKYSGSIGLVRDITKQVEEREILIREKQFAEEMNRIKNNFLSVMSHELRTPLTSIIGYAELLNEDIESKESREMIEMIIKGADRLKTTLNSILDLSRIEANMLKLQFVHTNISELVNSKYLFYKKYSEEKFLDFTIKVDNEAYALIDKVIFNKILDNLISNSIKYTNSGYINILTGIEESDGEKYSFVKVSDSGIGITDEQKEIIFEPFRQGSEGMGRKFEGTGLGLTLTKKFVELLGGKISFESKIGKGTEFKIMFPVSTEKSLKSVEEKLNDRKSKKFRLLLAEDDDDSAYILGKYLKKIGGIPERTNSGRDAVKMAKENKYDIIIMDIGLKHMNGLDATKEIRKIPGYEKIPIIAVTAYVMPGDEERIRQAGCNDYVQKPFSKKQLERSISEFVNTTIN